MAPSSRRLSSTEAVIGFLWDITFFFFVVRLSFVYAVLSVAASAAMACVAHAAVLPYVAARQHVGVDALVRNVLGASSTTSTALVVLVSTALFAVVGICGRVMMGYAKIPQVRGFRLAIGAMAAVYVGLGWLAALYFSPACGQGSTAAAKKAHGVVPTDNTLTLASFCQTSRLRVGGISSNTSISACTVVGLAFVAAVALVPWLSMILLEQPNRRYSRRHRRVSSNCGWLRAGSPSTTPTTPTYEKKALMSPDSSSTTASEDETATPKRTTRKSRTRTTRTTPKKRYSLRSSSERRRTTRL
ncbi:hypothetical protein Sste5346_000786 [Sporothrix stenoceras]|uniref:Integral membrane protein n=1 Tax=Sporothrix stenoceras TaxID=5173 RepID=A0ABR3ZQ92_9PEZI